MNVRVLQVGAGVERGQEIAVPSGEDRERATEWLDWMR
jgi:hypothetical protein